MAQCRGRNSDGFLFARDLLDHWPRGRQLAVNLRERSPVERRLRNSLPSNKEMG